ncbi:MAG: YgeY family selenium metabolism-linked hydrolase [Chloroflexi bacterium]|nr:YgeY family selenium metabolism-linked hydrolase [Chloroflexota bacterium]
MSTQTNRLNELAHRISLLSDSMAERQTRFLADLIRIRSYTGQERPAVERTMEELRVIGCDDVWMDSAGNALGRIGRGPRVILYDAHLDTNEVADEREWLHPPLEPVVVGDTMFGLGASDCKGGVAAIVYGAAILRDLTGLPDLSGLWDRYSLVIMGATLEEDAEGFALRSLVERDGLRPDVVLLAEATDLTLRRGQRGRCEVRVRTEGRGAHASQPHLGESAILKMLPVIAALEDMNGHLPVDPIFGAGNQVVTLIEGPHTPNSVPSWCEVAVDRRLVPGETADSVLAGIRAVIEPLGATAHIPVQPVTTHTGLRLDGPSFYPGWLLDEADPLLDAGRATCAALWGQAPRVDIWKFSTDGAYSAGAAGIPTLGFGPEEERYVHSALDQVNLTKLHKAAAFYALFPLIYR